MKLTFLCTNHREWLTSQPDQAIHCCANSCETGWNLYQQQRLDEALPYIGCAFDAAEILLSARQSTDVNALEWFLKTLSGLTLTLKNLGQLEDAKNVYHMAINRLQQELLFGTALKPYITVQINRLSHELKHLDYGHRVNIEQAYPVEQHQWGTTLH